MSTRSYRKKSNDNSLMKLFIGILVFLVLVIFSVYVYDKLAGGPKYSDYEHITEFVDVTNQSEDKYLVYYYSTNCHNCTEIKGEVFNFADNNPDEYKMYFVDANELDLKSLHPEVGGTPTLITIVNGQVVDVNGGSVYIPMAFDAINNGAYQPFQE